MPFNPKELGDKLRLEREKPPKLSQAAAAKLVGYSSRQWGEWEAGRSSPPLEALIDFCAARGISLGALIPISKDMPGLIPDSVEISQVPLVNHIPASGFITSYDDEFVSEWVVTSKKSKKGLFALRARGNSMAPKIEDGDVVICSPQEEFENNKIYAVVTTDSEHTLKLVQKQEDRYVCIPLNSALFQPMMLHESQVLRLIRVVEIIKKA